MAQAVLPAFDQMSLDTFAEPAATRMPLQERRSALTRAPKADSRTSPTGPCPCASLPEEILERILFLASRKPESHRDKVKDMSKFARVCKQWKPVAERLAFEILAIDPSDVEFLDFLDSPAASRLLAYTAQVLVMQDFSVFKKRNSSQSIDLEDDENDSPIQSDEEESGSAESDDASHENTNDDNEAPVKNMPKRSKLVTDPESLARLGRIFPKILEPRTLISWSSLQALQIIWWDFSARFWPILAVISKLPAVNRLMLEFKATKYESDGDPRTPFTAEEGILAIRPMRKLKDLDVKCAGFEAFPYEPLRRILSKKVPLHHLGWHGLVPAQVFNALSKGKLIEHVGFGDLKGVLGFKDQLLAHLAELDRREIEVLDIKFVAKEDEAGPTIDELLASIPPGAQMVNLVSHDPDEYFFAIGENGEEMFKRPRAPHGQRLADGTRVHRFEGKPLLQHVVLPTRLEPIGYKAIGILAFARYGDPKIVGDVTDWMFVPCIDEVAAGMCPHSEGEEDEADA